jgi:hypothetical protein
MNWFPETVFVPLYVDSYENVVSGLRQSKDRLVAKTLDAIGPGHEILLCEYVSDSRTAVAARNWIREIRPGLRCRPARDCYVFHP